MATSVWESDFFSRATEGGEGHTWPAWLLSVVFHASLLIACGLLAPAAPRPAGNEPERVVGIALVERTASAQPQYFSGGEASSATAASPLPVPGPRNPLVDQQLGQLPSLADPALDVAVQLPVPGTSASGSGAAIGLPSASGLTTSGGSAAPGQGKSKISGQVKTQVFGASGEGRKFVYIFDRSASMGGFDGRPLATSKAELTRSLTDLTSIHQFQIVFYNERPAVFNPSAPNRPSMLFATDEHKKLAEQFVESIVPVGGTRHREALELGLGMAPDVIFFLTDADDPELSADELADIRRRNRAASTIHCIEFGIGPFSGYENFLVKLARQNHGQHVYVDVTSLRPAP